MVNIYGSISAEETPIKDSPVIGDDLKSLDPEQIDEIWRRLKLAEEAHTWLPLAALENADTRRGQSPHDPELIEAVKNCNKPALKTFLAQGIDINGRDDTGETLLLRFVGSFPSSESEFEATVKAMQLLLDNGADLDVPNAWGISPLYAALCFEELKIARWLLEHGANSNTQQGGLLHVAIAKENLEFSALLLEYGADVNALWYNQTALDIAIKKRAKVSDDDQEDKDQYDQIIALLREHGAMEGQPRDEMENQSNEEHEAESKAENGEN
jgi:ankyrin repeat protein